MSTFLITGPWLTQHARDRVFEYGADDALRFLTDSLSGLDAALAGEVLAGKKKFVGDSRTEVDAVPDDDPADQPARDELAAKYRWHFAGVWFDRSAKVHMRPYAIVTGWGPDDIMPQQVGGRTVENKYRPRPIQSMLARCAGGNPEAWGEYRCVKYADDPVNDRVIPMLVPGHDGVGVMGRERMVLWKPVAAPPLWWPLPKDADEALAAYVAEFGELEERGAHIDYARDRAARERAKESMAPVGGSAPDGPLGGNVLGQVHGGQPPAEPPASSPALDLVRELLPPETPAHVREAIERLHADEELPKPVRVTDPAEAEYAWVARDGAFWVCRGFMDHKATAAGIAEHFGMDLARWKDNAEHALGELGWAKVGRTGDDDKKPFAWIDGVKTPSDAQFQAVFRWLVHHKADPLDIQAWADRAKRDT